MNMPRWKPEVNDFRAWLAFANLTAFMIVCVGAFYLVATAASLEAWAAGIIGTIIGYWANNVSQANSYYFGSTQSNKENRDTVNRMVDQQVESAKVAAAAQVDTAKALAKAQVKKPDLPPGTPEAPTPVSIVTEEPIPVDVVKPP